MVHPPERSAVVLLRWGAPRNIAIAEAFLLRRDTPRRFRDRARRYALPHIAPVLVVQLRTRIRHARPMGRIVLPCAIPVYVLDVAGIEIVLMNECVVDDHSMVAPAWMPAPTTPSMPAATEEKPYVNSNAKAKPHSAHDDASGRPVPAWIGIPERGSPDPYRIVDRDIHHRWIRRHDFNHGLAIVSRGNHVFLRRRRQFARLLGALPHTLYCIHHVLLLCKKRVAQIGRPRDVVIQPLQNIGKHYQSLNARVPILLLRGLGECRSVEAGITLEPLISLHYFQWIRTGYHDLAEQRVRIQRDGRHQVIELVRCQGLVRRRTRRRLILCEKK